ncbi:MAG TPA: YhdP family protein [Burkholderiaceae bacterium]|nr:YhdP family protein [Burkholderiaceae bacterium]
MSVPPQPLSDRLAGALLGLLGVVLCAACLGYLSVRWLVWPELDRWRPRIAAELGERLGRPVSIGALRPGWEGLHPSLSIDALRIDGDDGAPRLEVASAAVRIAWRSLAVGEPRLASLRLDAPRLVVERLASGRIAVAGVELPTDGPSDGRGLDWLLGQGEIVLRDARLRLVDRGGAVPEETLDGVAVAIRNVGRRHQAAVSIAGAGEASGALSLQAEFYRTPLSRPSDWRQWRGEAHLSVRDLDLARVAAAAAAWSLPMPPTIAGARGRVDALGWVRVEPARLVDATVKLRAEAPAFDLPGGRVELGALRGELRAERQRDGGHLLRIAGLSAVDAQGFALAADGDVEIGLDAAHAPRSASARLQRFDAGGALAAGRRLPLPEPLARTLLATHASGTVDGLALRWRRTGGTGEVRPADRLADAAAQGRLELSAGFDRLSLRLPPAPGGQARASFENLSGNVRASERGGTLAVAGRHGSIRLPGWLDEPTVPFERLEADVAWTADASLGDEWLRVEVPRLALANADGRVGASGHWRSGRGPGRIEVDARVERIDARRLLRYLPSRLPPTARGWLDRAVLAGVAEDVAIDWRGDLVDFPYRDPATGRFGVTGRVRDLSLAWSPDWPRLEQLRGELAIRGAGMEARVQGGAWAGLRLAEGTLRVADFREGVLQLEGRAAGPAQDLLRFVDESPLADRVPGVARALRASGDARLGLRSTVPLKDVPSLRLAGTVELAGNELTLDAALPPLRAATGRLEFTERGISLPELRATFLGGPLRVEGRPGADGRMRIDASGTLDAAGIRSVVDDAITRRLDGRADYRASVEVDRRGTTLKVESDLVGLSSTLPAPFAKPARRPMALRASSAPGAGPARPGRGPGERLELRLGDDVALVVERERDAATQRLAVRRAGIGIGVEPVLRDEGVSALVRTRSLDLDAWRALLGDDDGPGRGSREAGAGPSLVPDLVSISADELRVAGRELHDVAVRATRADGRWRASLAAREARGELEWREAQAGERIGALGAHFVRLAVPRPRDGEGAPATSTGPLQLPALDVRVDELVLGDVPVGSLELAATNGGTPAQPVWRIDRLVVVNPAARLHAQGVWSTAAGRPPGPRPGAPSPEARGTSLEFDLELRDAGALLTRFGLKDTMRGGIGTLGGTLRWDGSPVAIDYASLDGTMRVSIGRGEFLKVDPGLAKLIGVINMQSLPRRLAGDFRDLFGEGFAFDSIGGDVRVAAGIARTDALRLRGVQAQVTIRGEADLRNETQRLQVEVRPELNAGLASLAFGAMVNPVIGLGSFAAQYVLRGPLQEVLAYEVDVTGSWSDPTVSERTRRLAPQRPEHGD